MNNPTPCRECRWCLQQMHDIKGNPMMAVEYGRAFLSAQPAGVIKVRCHRGLWSNEYYRASQVKKR